MLCERGVRLSIWRPPEEPLRIHGNAAGVEQMLLNLLMNAADAVDAGSVGETVGIQTVVAPGTVEIQVWDRGRGMGPEEYARALEPFFSTRPEGTGLGLTVVRRIADAHGAELHIHSERGHGTTVTIKFSRNGSKPP
jgi:signal transduction histidine kinase